MVSEKVMPKPPQGYRWQVHVWPSAVEVELVNGSGTTDARRTVTTRGEWEIEAAMIEGARTIVDHLEIVAALRAKHGVAISLD